jgi:hypothetical protein
MKTLKLDLQNCYGIKKLKAQFDFSADGAFAIYAPNGSMKSSLAQTFDDISKDAESKDRIFPDRKTLRSIVDEAAKAILKESIVVIRPYDEVYGHTEKTSTLLVNATLRTEYEPFAQGHRCCDVLVKALRKQAGTKKDIESEISAAFTSRSDTFSTAVMRIRDEVFAMKDAPLAEVPYDIVFDDKVVGLLETTTVAKALREYVTQYNKLIAASTYFKKGVFNYYNAAMIARSLADNGFFDAKHTINLNAKDKVEITTRKQLEELVEKEKTALLSDKDLRKRFADIEKQINKNETLRGFHDYLQNHEDLLPSFENINAFKEDVWKSYLRTHVELLRDLVEEYQAAEKRTKEIEEIAATERTQWEAVIDVFNRRFFVPFTLTAKNRNAVVLGQEPLLSLGFTFNDGDDHVDVERDALLKVLSQGEKKALYILNIIFEVEARKQQKQETLFIVDDIADSFDYKNKYAIVEYLRDISEEPYFKQILLTHNFDFFRTCNGRFVPYDHCFMVTKSATELNLVQAVGIKNVFVKDWKLNFYKDLKKQIASIAFMRNIIEYTKGDKDPDYLKLTSLLHWRDDTAKLIISDVDTIFNALFKENGASKDVKKLAVDLIHEAAQSCLKADDGVNFENKIVLSIATRLAAEKYMIERLADKKFVSSIDTNQTVRLFTEFKKRFGSETQVLETLQGVVLITPESIHLNSFMYEPILDMSDARLKTLYADVRALASTPKAAAKGTRI